MFSLYVKLKWDTKTGNDLLQGKAKWFLPYEKHHITIKAVG